MELNSKKPAISKPCYIILPDSPIATSAEILSMLALVLIFFVLPFEISFVDAPSLPDPTDGLYIFNRLIDLVFVIDLTVTFFIAIEKKRAVDENDESQVDEGASELLKKNTVFEFRLRYIALHYLHGWLLLDAGSMAPSVFDIYFAILGQSGSDEMDMDTANLSLRILSEEDNVVGGTGGGSDGLAAARMGRTLKLVKFMRMARMMKMLRLLRLTKLIKVLGSDGIVKRSLDSLTVMLAEHTRKLRVLRLMCIMMLAAHLMCCMLGLSATFGDEKLASFWGTHGYCWPDQLYQLGPSEPLKSRCVGAGDQYLICFHLALALAFKVPFGPFVLRGPGVPYWANTESNVMFQPHEHAIFVIVGMIGAMLGMFVTGTFVTVIAAKDGATVTEQVTSFCRRYDVSHSSRNQMLKYFQTLGDQSGTSPRGNLFDKLSPTLLTELVLDIHGKWLYQLAFAPSLFHTLRPDEFGGGDRPEGVQRNGRTLLTKVALAMVPGFFVQRERPTTGRVYVVVRGIALQTTTGDVVSAGGSWGGYWALTSVPPLNRGTVKAMTNLHVVYIDSTKLKNIPNEFPEVAPSFLRIRVWALRLRLATGILRAAYIEKTRMEAATPGSRQSNQSNQSRRDSAGVSGGSTITRMPGLSEDSTFSLDGDPAAGERLSRVERRMAGVETQLAELTAAIHKSIALPKLRAPDPSPPQTSTWRGPQQLTNLFA